MSYLEGWHGAGGGGGGDLESKERGGRVSLNFIIDRVPVVARSSG